MKAQLTQEAKDAIIEAIHDGHEDYEMEWDNNHNEGLAHAISIIESFPTSSNEGGILVSDGGKPNPTDNWIPVSERFPNSSEYVIITNGRYVSFADYFDNKWYSPSNESPPFIYTDVTHWKPLPLPPVTK